MNNVMTYPCSKGHASTDEDFCSVCGTRIDSSISVANDSLNSSAIGKISTHGTASTPLSCPDCGTPHDLQEGKFCEICGHNFETGQSGEMPIDLSPIEIPTLYIPPIAGVELPPPPPPAPPISPNNLTGDLTIDLTGDHLAQSSTDSGTLNSGNLNSGNLNSASLDSPHGTIAPIPIAPIPIAPLWTLTITIDPSLAAPESPPPPTQPDISHTLSVGMAHLIGRTSAARGIIPEIALDFDNAISSRHALIACPTENQLILKDIGSSNGTQLNGVELEPMKDYPLKVGDRITLGHWTAIGVS